ncbi:hypothetical protein [Halolamina litorea]|uniref:Uncharacterized protein n=1 Tax=Halolamina litorea TaxID=1515593 RepID=A0ABD6BNI3_9EURY|nr:hypothetical protein [Halolamina litorea]
MDDRTSRLLADVISLLGLLCFVVGAAMLVTGAAVDVAVYALGALGLLFVGAGASIRGRE